MENKNGRSKTTTDEIKRNAALLALLNYDDATLEMALEMRRKKKLTTVHPSTCHNDDNDSTTVEQYNDVSTTSTCTNNASSEYNFQCDDDDEDPTYEYNSRDEFDDDHSLGNDSGVSSNDNDQNIIGGTVESAGRNDDSTSNDNPLNILDEGSNEKDETYYGNDDFASNDNGLYMLDEAPANNENDIVLPSTSGQAKKLWFDIKLFQHEDDAKAYLKENNYAITRTENRTTKIKHTFTRCNLVRKDGPKCKAQFAVRFDALKGTYLVQSNQLPHTCETIGNKVPIQLRLDCGKMRKADIPPRQAVHFLQEKFGEPAININKLYGLNKTYDVHNKRRLTTMGEVVEYLEHRKTFQTDDEPFVLNMKHSEISADETELQFVRMMGRSWLQI